MGNNDIIWLQKWFMSYCDDDWEHQYGVKIRTIDNPGWLVEIDLLYTGLSGVKIENTLIENSESDWYSYMIKDGLFKGAGDPTKLNTILGTFRKIVESTED